MPRSSSATPGADASDRDLALWMLERMRESDTFLESIRAARSAGGTDMLDRPEYTDAHRVRLAPLFEGDKLSTLDVSETVDAAVTKLKEFQLLSGNEELLEKVLAAFLAKHPKIATTVPADWPSTIDAARAEVEGKTKGRFRAGFTADLASAARRELERNAQADRSKSRDTGRES